jgi:rhodanese-related sulfurtransferase
MIVRVDALEAERLIAGGITVVDVLPATTFQQEHLPGALNVPLETFEPSHVASLDKAAALLVYCFDQH